VARNVEFLGELREGPGQNLTLRPVEVYGDPSRPVRVRTVSLGFVSPHGGAQIDVEQIIDDVGQIVFHDLVIPLSGGTLHCSCSVVGIHQSIRIDPQEARFHAGIQDHLDLNGITDDRLTVSGMGDSPRINLYHLGFIITVELPAEEEFLTDPDVSVFHDSVIPHRLETLHSVAISPVKEAKHHKRTDEEKDSSCHVHTSIKS
jgi:hypothetical protein